MQRILSAFGRRRGEVFAFSFVYLVFANWGSFVENAGAKRGLLLIALVALVLLNISYLQLFNRSAASDDSTPARSWGERRNTSGD